MSDCKRHGHYILGVVCPDCQIEERSYPAAEVDKCPECGGSGEAKRRPGCEGYDVFLVCQTCRGTGKKPAEPVTPA